jgi:phosphoribosylformylglycinamidine (FGAM) synthase PurS component
MNYCVEVSTRSGLRDSRAEDLKGQIELLGIPGVESVEIADRYYLSGTVTPADVERLTTELLCDPVVDEARVINGAEQATPTTGDAYTIDVVLHPGVTDTPAESLMSGLSEIGVDGIEAAATGTRYTLRGDLDPATVSQIATSLLANPVIQTWHIDEPPHPPFAIAAAAGPGTVETIPNGGSA